MVKKIAFFLSLALATLVFVGGILLFLLPLSPTPTTNILILGIAGQNQKGGDLTDTIIFTSINHQNGEILFLSLPRDIWITPWRTKLNSIYHYKGMKETKKIVAQILGQPVDYGVLIDFDLFTQIIDLLGGVEVEVERGFDDYYYPVAGKENDDCGGDPELRCRYEHLHFEPGRQWMDGERALKYVRSRHAEGEEGTDFARTRRQQRLLLALKEKILNPRFFLDPRQPLQLFKLVSLNIQTDLPKEKYWLLLQTFLKSRGGKIKTETLDERFLINPSLQAKYDYQWVLVPKKGNWSEVQEHIKKLISND